MTTSHTRADEKAAVKDQTPCRVVVFGMTDDPHQLRDLLARVLHIHPVDAQIQVRSLPGVLPQELVTHQAAELAAAIRDLGVNATSIPVEEVPNVERVLTVHHARCLDEGFEIVGLRGKRDQLISWDQVSLISVGLVSESEAANVTTTSVAELGLGPPRRSPVHAEVEHQNLMAFIAIGSPNELLRIDHGKMNYDYLGDQVATSATVNFRRLVSDVTSKAEKASVTPATRAFCDHGLLRHYEFDSLEEFRRYTLFQLLLRHSHLAS